MDKLYKVSSSDYNKKLWIPILGHAYQEDLKLMLAPHDLSTFASLHGERACLISCTATWPREIEWSLTILHIGDNGLILKWIVPKPSGPSLPIATRASWLRHVVDGLRGG